MFPGAAAPAAPGWDEAVTAFAAQADADGKRDLLERVMELCCDDDESKQSEQASREGSATPG